MATIYDVALSFTAEDRPVAKVIANALAKNGIKVFFDENASTELWGQDLYNYLQRVYEDSKICIVLLSKAYTEKQWTHNEFINLLAHSKNRPSFSLLPINLDLKRIPKELESISYVDWDSISSPQQLAEIVKDRLVSLSPKEQPDKRKSYHVIKRESGWSVKKEGASRATSIHSTQKEAIRKALNYAKRHKPATVVVHSADGSIESQETISTD